MPTNPYCNDSMKLTETIFDLPVPKNKTALMQHLQNLVLRGSCWWVGGIVPRHKFQNLALKFSVRYPLLRNERGRTYDRSKGLAAFHFVAFPVEEGIAWWLMSTSGRNGLQDESSPDYHVAKHALAANGHIVFGDYVLLYAHKKDARTVLDAKSGKEKQIIKDCSTWTWKMTSSAYGEVAAAIKREVDALNYGDDSTQANFYGLRGVLAFQRRRPLFAGVRAQVIQLHRLADSDWSLVRKTWIARHRELAEPYGSKAGELLPIKEITSKYMPKMVRTKVFSTGTIGELISPS